MRRKNRKWVAIAAALYLFVMWSAYRWAISERPTDGPLLDHIENEAVRKQAERRAEEARKQSLPPNGESRLNAAGPAFVAARYDATHVVFMVATDTESRFPSSALTRDGTPTRISAPAQPAAPLAGLQELWEPDSQSLHFFPKIIQAARPGDQWIVNVGPGLTMPVAIERPVIAPLGCSLALGFLASVPADQQSAFATSSRDYFAVRRTAVEPASPPVAALIGEIPGWKISPAMAQPIENQLNARMKQELAQIDARLRANAASPGATAGDLPIGGARPYLKEWMHADRALARGQGSLDYDLRAFHLTPDGAPRLYVRARWKLDDAPVFVMTAWFKLETPKLETTKSAPPQPASLPELISADSSWALAMRQSEAPATLGDTLDFQTILNEFDADHDGWAELLIFSQAPYPEPARSQNSESQDSAPTSIGLYLYTDAGLIPMRTPLRRDTQSPASCVAP